MGEFIVVLDSMDRENEGDLIIAAEDITTEKMAFMVRHSRFVRHPANSIRDIFPDSERSVASSALLSQLLSQTD